MKYFEYRAFSPNELAVEHPKGQRSGLDLLKQLGEDGWLLTRITNIFKDDEEWIMAREWENSAGIDVYACGHEYEVDHGMRRRFDVPCPNCYEAHHGAGHD